MRLLTFSIKNLVQSMEETERHVQLAMQAPRKLPPIRFDNDDFIDDAILAHGNIPHSQPMFGMQRQWDFGWRDFCISAILTSFLFYTRFRNSVTSMTQHLCHDFHELWVHCIGVCFWLFQKWTQRLGSFMKRILCILTCFSILGLEPSIECLSLI